MKKVIYNGPHATVDVYDKGALVLEGVKRGAVVDVPDSIAERLLKQSSWSAATKATAPKGKKAE